VLGPLLKDCASSFSGYFSNNLFRVFQGASQDSASSFFHFLDDTRYVSLASEARGPQGDSSPGPVHARGLSDLPHINIDRRPTRRHPHRLQVSYCLNPLNAQPPCRIPPLLFSFSLHKIALWTGRHITPNYLLPPPPSTVLLFPTRTRTTTPRSSRAALHWLVITLLLVVAGARSLIPPFPSVPRVSPKAPPTPALPLPTTGLPISVTGQAPPLMQLNFGARSPPQPWSVQSSFLLPPPTLSGF